MSDHDVIRRIGVVGSGAMGRPLIQRLLGAGFDVAVFARRDDVRADLAEAGCEVVSDLRSLGEGRDVVVLYVYSDEQVLHLALEQGLVAAMGRGSLLMIATTGSPQTALTIEAFARARGVGVVDAAASGGPAQVLAGTLTVFVGGAPEDVQRLQPVFDAYAARAAHFGPLGSGQRVKLINNMLFGAQTELALEATRLAEAFDIDVGLLVETLGACSGANASLGMIRAMGSPQALLDGAGWTIHKDVRYALALLAEQGEDLGSFGPVLDAALTRTEPYGRESGSPESTRVM